MEKEDLDKIEEELIEKDCKAREQKMPVSGKSVFALSEILRRKGHHGNREQPDN